jgi:hypothetical protein
MSSGDDGQSLAVQGVGVAPGGGTTTLTPEDLLTDGHHGDAQPPILPDRHQTKQLGRLGTPVRRRSSGNPRE